jgi:hypothetical protein
MPSLRFSTLALAVLLSGCATMKVQSEFNPKAPFESYRTYTWLKAAPGTEQAPAVRDPDLRARVIMEIDRELAKKGLTPAPEGAEPDLLVWVHGFHTQRIDVANYGYAYGGAYMYGPYGGAAVAMPVVDVRQYADGTLLIDLVDAKTKELSWRGTATDTAQSADQLRANIGVAIKKLMEIYPPKPRG